MKRQRPDKRPDRELRHVINRVLPLVPRDRAITKADFETILGEVMACVDEKTTATHERLRQVTAKLVADLPDEYRRLPKRQRSWPVLIGYLYSKYLHELRKPGMEAG